MNSTRRSTNVNKDLGPKVLPGYPGSGLSKYDEDHQPVLVKVYRDGK
jgi:hypothetical protein